MSIFYDLVALLCSHQTSPCLKSKSVLMDKFLTTFLFWVICTSYGNILKGTVAMPVIAKSQFLTAILVIDKLSLINFPNKHLNVAVNFQYV